MFRINVLFGLWWLVIVGGCAAKATSMSERLRAADPGERIRAVTEIARGQDPQHMMNVVQLLDDDDAAVRFAAILALQQWAGSRLGYEYGASAQQREAAIQKWKDYVTQRSEAHAQTDTMTTSGDAPAP